MSGPCHVRRASVAADVDDLLVVSTELFREDAGTHDPETMNVDWPAQHGRSSFEALLSDADRVGLLAEVDGRLAGGLMGSVPGLSPYDLARTARLNSLWVHHDHRGGGVGASLVEAFLEWARERGAPYASVTAYAANEGAVAFYGRQGFGPHTVTLRQRL